MKQIWRVLAAPSTLFLLGLCAWIGCEVPHARSSSADGIAFYGQYRASMPEPQAMQKITKNGEDFYVCFGPVRMPLILRSGPPAYVFDAHGNLVDWTLDTGDDSRFSSAWGIEQGTDFEIEDYEKLLAQNRKGV
ncbi:hypothetical protein FEM03_13520 [Phragmitibacter flavus]|uniref:Uncharacterized protein n=1 Tax=Phragmitibacter flavus TaxID=2576071 RepID=A0A5R8KD15_9BACT|nr:hypothetical protein [Phragmitibacter flavus]TLD70204.1 hypothetical protein FEM03_13520 [Phragmitibacter flavus]